MSKQFDMIMKKFVCVCLVIVFVKNCFAEGCNITRRSRVKEGIYPDGSSKQRYPRLLTFHTLDNDVVADLEFAVPFISIPVKRTMDKVMGWGSGLPAAAANINVGALVLAGGMVVGAGIAIPLITSFVTRQVFVPHNQRSADWTETWPIVHLVDKALSENNIDSKSCMQRTICWFTKTSSNKFKTGQVTSQDMLINGLATNGWVNEMMNGTAVHAAVIAGLANVNCSNKYKDCKITQKSIQGLFGKLWSFLRFK